MDHDQVAVVTFARYAGTASPWHEVLQRIGSWSDVLGTFVAPDELFQRTEARDSRIAFEADAFPVPPPPATGDPVGDAALAAAAEARRIVAAAAHLRPWLPSAAAHRPAAPPPLAARPAGRWPWSRRDAGAGLVLDNGLIRLQAHPQTGGLLSLRRPADRSNRISQQLALRTTRPAPAGREFWDSAEDRAEHGRMRAEAVARIKTAAGDDCIESRGRLLAADGRDAGGFVQRMTLVPGLPLAVLDLDVRLDRAVGGPLFEEHVACRFAWHENEDVEIFRSLLTQAVVTTRTRFTAPHFVALRNSGRGGDADDVEILSGGLPWHVHSSPNVLDTILLGGAATTATRRLAVGIGLARPWDESLRLLAGAAPDPVAAPANVRLLAGPVGPDAAGGVRAVVDLLEVAGRAGEVRVEWAREPRAVQACDFAGRPRDDVAVAVAGRSIVVSLRRHEWLRLHLDFPA
jgi:hypothetical protein